MPLETLDGQMILNVGPAPAPAKVSVQPGKGKASQISVTYGLHGSGSLASASLTQSLANRLRVKTDLLGSTLFRLTWKERVTPSGRRICALRASALRISDKGCTSWATPQNHDAKGTWRAGSGENGKDPQNMHALQDQAQLSSWATPATRDSKGAKGKDELLMGGMVAPWPTPSANNYEQTDQNALEKRRQECKERTGNGNGFGLTLANAAQQTDSGGMSNGSTAATGNIGQLNPALPCWLQGLPTEWESSADLVTRSVRRSRKRSLKAT